MPLFDFAAFVNRYAMRSWSIARVGRRISQIFAQQFSLNLSNDKRHTKVIARTNTVRKLWTRRLKELAAHNLWFPNTRDLNPYAADFDLKKFALSFQRCFFCRPSYLYFRWKTQKVFRPCQRYYFCPFCFSRISQAQYVHVKQKLRAIGRHNSATTLIITGRVASRFVSAAGFDPILGCSNAKVAEYAQLLWGELRRERSHYQKCVKQLNRKTLGSMWRVVVVPCDDGWLIESRQILLHYPKTKLPFVRQKNSRVTYLKSIRVADCYDVADTDFYFILGQFNRYPIELLSGYAELVAAYLRAVDGMHTISGTGVFRKAGASLVGLLKRGKHDASGQRQADKQSDSPEEIAARRAAVASTP